MIRSDRIGRYLVGGQIDDGRDPKHSIFGGVVVVVIVLVVVEALLQHAADSLLRDQQIDHFGYVDVGFEEQLLEQLFYSVVVALFGVAALEIRLDALQHGLFLIKRDDVIFRVALLPRSPSPRSPTPRPICVR